jgi:hypothetical protein
VSRSWWFHWGKRIRKRTKRTIRFLSFFYFKQWVDDNLVKKLKLICCRVRRKTRDEWEFPIIPICSNNSTWKFTPKKTCIQNSYFLIFLQKLLLGYDCARAALVEMANKLTIAEAKQQECEEMNATLRMTLW